MIRQKESRVLKQEKSFKGHLRGILEMSVKKLIRTWRSAGAGGVVQADDRKAYILKTLGSSNFLTKKLLE